MALRMHEAVDALGVDERCDAERVQLARDVLKVRECAPQSVEVLVELPSQREVSDAVRPDKREAVDVVGEALREVRNLRGTIGEPREVDEIHRDNALDLSDLLVDVQA